MPAIVRKLFDLFTLQERRKLLLVCGAVVLHALVETAGIASIVPFLTLVANPSAVHDNAVLYWLFTTLRFSSVNWFLLFVGFMVLGVLVLSNAIAAVATWAMLRFSWMQNHSLSRRLLASYLDRPYVFFLNQNTATLGRNILMETQQVVNGLVIPAMWMLAKGFVILFIFALLLAINPVLAMLMIGALGSAYGVIYAFAHRKLARIGRERAEANRERFKVANEAFGAIKLLKLLGKDKLFIERYSTQSLRYSDRLASAALISSIPRYAMETIAFGSILVVVLYLLGTHRNLEQVLPLVGLYAFAGYRLMPAFQVLFSGVAKVKFNAAALDVLHEGLERDLVHATSACRDAVPLPFHETLELRNAKFRYPGAGLPVIEGLNLTIDAGSSVGFAGKTGSGKTTTVDLILGLLRLAGGGIYVDGIEVTDENLGCWQQNLGYVPQEIYLTDDTVARNIALGMPDEQIDTRAVERAARIANVHDFILTSLPDGYQTSVGERGVRLSGGERQRIGIARALYHDPAVLVLDEATSSLDGVTEKGVFKAIANVAKVKTLIIIAHRLTTVKDCDVVYVVDDGRIVAQGKYDELMSSNEHFRNMAKMSGQTSCI
ncbi:ABC transporter ATP-binding protein [Candidatus Bipolaricaulota bacterium]